MLDREGNEQKQPSRYWQEEIEGFAYMLDASPLIIERLREHCYHLTGLHAYQYRSHHSFRADAIENRLRSLQKLDRRSMSVAEAPDLGGFGYEIDGALFNIDTLRYYESLIALDEAGLLSRFSDHNKPPGTVVEIGAGWGGFAYQFKTLFPSSRFVVIDLPQSLLFSITYLSTMFPQAMVSILESCEDEEPPVVPADDFTFVPHFAIDRLRGQQVDLALNMASFQEMTDNQVEDYAAFLNSMHCPALYSYNRDRNPNNPQRRLVSEILNDHYVVEQIELLPSSHLGLWNPQSDAKRGSGFQLRSLLRKALGHHRRETLPPEEYRHLVGTLKI
jgi:putative sugar O-methyltransferase